MKSIFQINNELNASEKLSTAEAVHVVGGFWFRRSWRRRAEGSNATAKPTYSLAFTFDVESATDDDKRRQRPGGGTTTTSPSSFIDFP
jgi:hypothetical protein